MFNKTKKLLQFELIVSWLHRFWNSFCALLLYVASFIDVWRLCVVFPLLVSPIALWWTKSPDKPSVALQKCQGCRNVSPSEFISLTHSSRGTKDILSDGKKDEKHADRFHQVFWWFNATICGNSSALGRSVLMATNLERSPLNEILAMRIGEKLQNWSEISV